MEALPISLQLELSPQFFTRIQHWLQNAETTATTELIRHQEQLDAMPLRLTEVETLHRQDLIAMLGAPQASMPQIMPCP